MKYYYNILKWYILAFFRYFIYRPGKYAERCDYHVGPILAVNVFDDQILISGFDGNSGNCSITNCGVRIVSNDEYVILKHIYQELGDVGLAIYHGWTKESYLKFKQEWKPKGESDASNDCNP